MDKNSYPNYETMEKNNKLIINFRNLGHKIRFLFEGKGSQKRVLILLQETENMTQRELTEKMGVQPGSASEVIGKLENAGFIERTPSQIDRRTVNIKLTEMGRIQAEEVVRQRKIRHQEMFSCLSEEEKDTLLALTEKLNNNWNNHYCGNERTFDHSLHGKHHDFHKNQCELYKKHHELHEN